MKTKDIVDIDILEKREYFCDGTLYHLTNGYKWILKWVKDFNYFSMMTAGLYDMVKYACVIPQPYICSYSPTYRRVLVSVYISELNLLIEKMENIASNNKDTEIYVHSLEAGKVLLSDIIKCYRFEVEVLKELLSSNFKAFEEETEMMKAEVEIPVGLSGDYEAINLPLPTTIDMHKLYIESLAEKHGRDDKGHLLCDTPIEDIISCEMQRRGIDMSLDLSSKQYSREDYRKLVLSKEKETIVLVRDIPRGMDKKRTAVLCYMLKDALKEGKVYTDILVKAISYVNDKDIFKENTKDGKDHIENASAYKYVHNQDELRSELRYVVEQFKRYKIDMGKLNLSDVQKKQFKLDE